MSSLRIVGGTLGAAILVLAWSIGRETIAGPLDRDAWVRRSTPAVSEGNAPHRAARPGRLIDRYGNELERAVTDYRIDYRGDLYERHSPQTAVPRLGPPVG